MLALAANRSAPLLRTNNMTSGDPTVGRPQIAAFRARQRLAAWPFFARWPIARRPIATWITALCLAAPTPATAIAQPDAAAATTSSPTGNASPHTRVTSSASGSPPTGKSAEATPSSGSSSAISRAIAGAIERALPEVYEKQDDWGATKTIAVGLKGTGKGLNFDIKRRRKEVPHGLWKHYKIQRRQGGPSPSVQLENLRVTSEGTTSFRLTVDVDFDYWARAKLYQYGIHLLAVEAVGSCKATLRMDGEMGLRFGPVEGSPGVAIDPAVTDAQLIIHEWRVERVSNMHGPLIEELGDGVRRLIEREMNGPALTSKLNRAIDKKRDRLQVPLALPAWGDKR